MPRHLFASWVTVLVLYTRAWNVSGLDYCIVYWRWHWIF